MLYHWIVLVTGNTIYKKCKRFTHRPNVMLLFNRRSWLFICTWMRPPVCIRLVFDFEELARTLPVNLAALPCCLFYFINTYILSEDLGYSACFVKKIYVALSCIASWRINRGRNYPFYCIFAWSLHLRPRILSKFKIPKPVPCKLFRLFSARTELCLI